MARGACFGGAGKKLRGALALAREPDAYAGGLTPEDGGAWLVGDEAWGENPAWVVDQASRSFVRLWTACRSGMGGYSHWPDAGGVADQAAWVVDGFGVLTGTSARWDDATRKRHSGT